MRTTGLFWFQNDLRLHDHPGLSQMQHCEQLICVFCIDPAWFRPNGFNGKAMGEKRWHFLQAALADLSAQLEAIGQHLLIIEADPVAAISKLIEQYQVSVIGRSRHAGVYENRQWQQLQQQYPECHFNDADSATLFAETDLPFELDDLPATFSQFRKLVEDLPINRPMTRIERLPSPPLQFSSTAFTFNPLPNSKRGNK